MKRRVFLLMVLSFILAGCGPKFTDVYRPDMMSLNEIGSRQILQARSALVAALRSPSTIYKGSVIANDVKVEDVQIYRDSIRFSFTGSTLGYFKDGTYSGEISITLTGSPHYVYVSLYNPSDTYNVSLPGKEFQTLIWKDDHKADAVSFAKALNVLISREFQDYDGALYEFKQKARAWHQLSIKPELPEETRRYLVLAENATEDKRLDDAIDLYLKALQLTPCWPQSHYNLALILAHQELYPEAILQMKEYLELAPDAPDARAAKDQIWGWEEKNK